MARNHKIATWRYINKRLKLAESQGRVPHASVWYTLKLKMVRELIYV